jgi:hypothetical protein
MRKLCDDEKMKMWMGKTRELCTEKNQVNVLFKNNGQWIFKLLSSEFSVILQNRLELFFYIFQKKSLQCRIFYFILSARAQ